MECRNPSQYKTLPCFNFLSTGYCKYEHKCHFIHDERIRYNKPVDRRYISDKRNSTMSEEGYMLIYWPQMYYPSREYSPEMVSKDEIVNSTWKRFVEDMYLFKPYVIHSGLIYNFST